MKKITGLFMAAQLSALLTFAQKPAILLDNKPGWKKIGETSASFGKENESIIVLGDDQFESIKLKINDAPLRIERLQVFYESGEMKDFDVKNNIGQGSETQAYGLDANKEISKVAFTYKTDPNKKGNEASVSLFGLVPGEKDSSKEEKQSYKQNDRDPNFAKQSAKTMAEVTDKRYHKLGPEGQAIYVEQTPKYYYVNEKGDKVYVAESRLKNSVNE